MRVYRRRDLTIIGISDHKSMVMACDSCGGIGEKPNDSLKAPAVSVGAHTARVSLMEVLSTGAEIISISNAVCCEMYPTGDLIIEGIKAELLKAGISNAVLNGSTEENIVTSMTAVGVSIMGIVDTNQLRFGPCFPGDNIVLIGQPFVGSELLDSNRKIPSYSDIYKLLQNPNIREIVPVGSKGIRYEAESLAKLHNLKFRQGNTSVNLNKSAGPCTCLIVAATSDWICDLSDSMVIGNFR